MKDAAIILEHDVIPTFYNNQNKWKLMMRNSIYSAIDFTAHRMIKEYQQKFYQNQIKETMVYTK